MQNIQFTVYRPPVCQQQNSHTFFSCFKEMQVTVQGLFFKNDFTHPWWRSEVWLCRIVHMVYKLSKLTSCSHLPGCLWGGGGLGQFKTESQFICRSRSFTTLGIFSTDQLNMELEISKVYVGSMCTAQLYSLAETPQPLLTPFPAFGHIYEDAIGQPI
jgi:hypothetical protein